MKTSLYLRYVSINPDEESNIPLGDLGNSLVAFERLVSDLSDVCRLDTKVEVLATTHREGSHIVDLLLQAQAELNSLPFESTDQLLEFLKLTSVDLWQEAVAFFNDLKDIHRTVNDFGNKHTVDITLFALLIPWVMSRIKKLREKPIPVDDHFSERMAREIYKLIEKNRFGSFVQPIADETAKSIEVSTDRKFKSNVSRIDNSNFEDFMGKDSEILPNLKDGQDCELTGEVTSLKSTRGDSLTFHIEDKGKSHNLDVFPGPEKTSKSYVDFYQEKVNIKATVERVSLYKKPKLHLIDMHLAQPRLDFGDERQ